jgi:hypothetical protein
MSSFESHVVDGQPHIMEVTFADDVFPDPVDGRAYLAGRNYHELTRQQQRLIKELAPGYTGNFMEFRFTGPRTVRVRCTTLLPYRHPLLASKVYALVTGRSAERIPA